MSYQYVKNNTDRMSQLVEVDLSTRVEVHVTGDPRHVYRPQMISPPVKVKHRQNEPAGQVDIPTRVEVHVTGDPGQM